MTTTPTTNSTNQINVLKLIGSRILEIKKLDDECKRKVPKLASQRLPRYMRRRAASHNIKRIPKFARPRKELIEDKKTTRTHKLLLRYRRRKSFRKCKRRKKSKKDKTPIHNWLAKRFKMDKNTHFPLVNSTKNQRSLYRKARDSCAYFYEPSLQPLKIKLLMKSRTVESTINSLNRLCNPATGFTFLAKSIQDGNYEVLSYIYTLDQYPLGFICPIRMTFLNKTTLLLWIPQAKFEMVLDQIKLALNCPSDVDEILLGLFRAKMMRFRLIGPKSYEEASRICPSTVDLRSKLNKLSQSYQTSIGCRTTVVVEQHQTSITFIKYNSTPLMIDVTIPIKAKGKLIWYELIKNRSHLMGGMRDLELVSINHPEISRYPWFNQADSVVDDCVNRKKMIADILCKNGDDSSSSAFVVRDEEFLDKLTHLGHYKSVLRLLDEYKNIIDIDNALLNVEIRLEGKGNVNKYDRLFIAKKDYLERIVTRNKDDNGDDDDDDDDTVVANTIGDCCGFIENGAFSMFTGCERAYGVLKLNRFVELISNQAKSPVKIDKFDMRVMVQLNKSGNKLCLARLVPMRQ